MTPSSSVAPSPANASITPLSVVTGREAIDPPIRIEAEPLLKRSLDLAFCGVLLVATAPAWPLIAAAVKLEDGGPVFYRQRRWGQGGRLFDVFKFRTMISDSDEKHGVVEARDEDHRVTRVGAVLRSFGIDELPQVLNILKGEMSFVGPRPLAVGEIVHDDDGNPTVWDRLPEFRRRMSVRWTDGSAMVPWLGNAGRVSGSRAGHDRPGRAERSSDGRAHPGNRPSDDHAVSRR